MYSMVGIVAIVALPWVWLFAPLNPIIMGWLIFVTAVVVGAVVLCGFYFLVERLYGS